MFIVTTKAPGVPAHEIRYTSKRDYQDHLRTMCDNAIFANRGFVFCRDVGASLPMIKFDDGCTVEVRRAPVH